MFAKPFAVNLLILVPFIVFLCWRKRGLNLSKSTLVFLTLFGIAFGFAEAATIIYLRVPTELLPGYMGDFSALASKAGEIHAQAELVDKLPPGLYALEFTRESLTMLMLISIAMLSSKLWPERFSAFLWTFAIWDISYYVILWLFIRWPSSLLDYDFLFLVPVPWYAQVWYPLLVSMLTLLAIIALLRSRPCP
ncbi:MAG: hypothetical protein A2Y62_17385 [Candidatus Fischerbacteria bacterium RBG_13_37_8]|uniref:Uncharacterized protein n=1 Tax=Candidatus Fischerbacteria bacterium RBG_13_37_8 TaxID=1817863 RepID=A0A1F5VN51_9BACT|nr:MAG: hypothetical protein A2Y62_17385 [Candidatus Fischerbacteria bacterium RBG_13_37_8]